MQDRVPVPVAVALTRGPAHVIVALDDGAKQLLGDRQVVGIPLREAYAEDRWTFVWDVLDAVFADQEPATFPIRNSVGDCGTFTVQPHRFEDGALGLVTMWRPGHAPSQAPRARALRRAMVDLAPALLVAVLAL